MDFRIKSLEKKYIFLILGIGFFWIIYFFRVKGIISSYLYELVVHKERIPYVELNFNSLLIFYSIITVIISLILSLWKYLQRFINIEYIALFLCVLIFRLSQKDIYLYQSKRLWFFFIFFIILHFARSSRFLHQVAEGYFRKFISSQLFISTISVIFLIEWFLCSFPLKEWTSYITVDDYPAVYALSKRGADIIKQGGYFGWDSSFVGGYFTATEMGMNLVHFLFPLSFLGWEIGFHLLIFISFLSFPLLCFYYIKICCKVEEHKALLTLPVAAILVLYYFKRDFSYMEVGLLSIGMLAAFIGVDLFILSLIILQRLKERKPYTFFLLTFSLSLLFYTHLGFFIYTIMFILIDFLAFPKKESFRYLFYLGCLLLAITSPFLIYQLKYSNYLILDNRHYLPPKFLLDNYPINLLRSLFYLLDYTSWIRVEAYYPLLFSPVLIYLFYQKTWRREVMFILFISIFYVMVPSVVPSLYLLFSRIRFLTPFFLSIILTGFLITNYEKRYFLVLLSGLLICMFINYPFVLWPYRFEHSKPGNFYNKPLVEIIKRLEGRYIAVENNQHWNHWGKKIVPDFHWLPLLQLETKKFFFSNMYDGYHHTPYRANSFEGGFFRGRLIDTWNIAEINTILSDWGIKYLVVWNQKTKEYFSHYPDFFSKIWQDRDWIIFQFKNADIRSATVENGGDARVIDNDFFEKIVVLRGVKKDSKVVIRSNYFPAWRAYYNSREISLKDCKGQMSFIAPDSGDYQVTLRYPRYTFLNILAIFGLIMSFILRFIKMVP